MGCPTLPTQSQPWHPSTLHSTPFSQALVSLLSGASIEGYRAERSHTEQYCSCSVLQRVSHELDLA